MRNQFLMATLVTVLSGTVSVMSAGEGEVAVTPGQSVTVTTNTEATSPAVPGKPTDKAIVAMLANSMSCDFNNVPLNQVIGYIQKLSGGALKVSVNAKNLPETAVDEDGNVIVPITLHAQKMQLQNVLFWAAHLAGMECEIKDDVFVMAAPGLIVNPIPLHVPGEKETEWYRDIEDKLTKKCSFDVQDMSDGDIFQFLEHAIGKTIVVDKAVTREPFGLRVKDMPLSLALKWVCARINVKYTIAHEAIFVTRNSANDTVKADE